ncbi:MAG: hypothetical protein IPL97_00975 [Niastella sp.]|nr:hypothetical protein [Niastella sp.]
MPAIICSGRCIKKSAFNISKGRHEKLYKAVFNTLSSQISNGQTLTEETWIQYLGSATVSGIGFIRQQRPIKIISLN